MAYCDELIEHAVALAERNLQSEPKQVDLRRAVSAAYYALFHLLTMEAAQNWKNEGQRNRFARLYDHGRMKTCSSRMCSSALPNDPAKASVSKALKVVAESFVELQEARHTADYDNSRVWSRTLVYERIAQAEEAIAVWSTIREHELAQNFLLDLMGTRYAASTA